MAQPRLIALTTRAKKVTISDNERKLYEDKIRLMEEIIENLKKEVERLKTGK